MTDSDVHTNAKPNYQRTLTGTPAPMSMHQQTDEHAERGNAYQYADEYRGRAAGCSDRETADGGRRVADG
jgi:hypothetical protein